MYKTDFIVKYHDIENELIRRLELRLAAEAAAQITAAIESVFRNSGEHSNENIVINIEVGGTGDSDDEGNGRHRFEIMNSNRTNNNIEEGETVKEEEESVKEEGEEVVKEEEAVKEDDDDDEDYKYNRKDVTYICDKLYRDELLTAFGAETIDDPEMDEGIKMIFEALINNEEFQQFLKELNALLLDTSTAKTETELANMKRNTDYLIFITLFSQQSFYLTHKCLCEMLTLGKVNPELMLQLKQRTMKIFSLN
jgi:hypothetical protein